jgi:hypothetical protein
MRSTPRKHASSGKHSSVSNEKNQRFCFFSPYNDETSVEPCMNQKVLGQEAMPLSHFSSWFALPVYNSDTCYVMSARALCM